MTSQNFSSNCLSFDSLKGRERCGLMSLATHNRCTLAADMPAARGILRALPHPPWGGGGTPRPPPFSIAPDGAAASPPAPSLAAPPPLVATACARALEHQSILPARPLQNVRPSGLPTGATGPFARRSAAASDPRRSAG